MQECPPWRKAHGRGRSDLKVTASFRTSGPDNLRRTRPAYRKFMAKFSYGTFPRYSKEFRNFVTYCGTSASSGAITES